jgi:cellulose synthase/poly-beta-1,6-N-acetylglucosamine synthase-like glycosyltransferase
MKRSTLPVLPRRYRRRPIIVPSKRPIHRSDYIAPQLVRRVYLSGRHNQPITMTTKKTTRIYRRRLALLIAAHNEELVIEQTLRSAIRAGMKPGDIYVVDDNSSDATGKIVRAILGRSQLMRVQRSGKGLALAKATKKFKLTDRYEWIHIADADGGFAPDYFSVFRAKLNPKYAAATGYIRSIPSGSISQYRTVEYTLGMEIHRRFQAFTNTVTVIPGPSSCFRADVFAQVSFANQAIAEDFDVTMQLHRKKLGRVQFIPEAVAYTQEPRALKDYVKQITRWNRGILQGIRRHRVGLSGINRVDAYLLYQISQNFLFMFNYFVLLPILAISRHSSAVVAYTFLYDVLITLALTGATAMKARRPDVISAFPLIYLYRWISMAVFIRAFVEVMILGKFKVTSGVWGTSGRRYKTDAALLSA